MKTCLIVLAFSWSCASIDDQDALFTFQSPFGSDGTNQPGISSEVRNELVFEHIWMDYVHAREDINRSLPVARTGGYSQEQTDQWHIAFRYGRLLESMIEIRALTTQNKISTNKRQQDEIARTNKALSALDLHYGGVGSGQKMVDICAKRGLDQILPKLNQVLRNEDGTLRPIPPIQLDGVERPENRL